MVNDIINGIAIALSEFSGVHIYTDEVRQNLEEPCFLVDMVDEVFKERLNQNYAVHPSFQIVYLGLTQAAVQEMAEKLPYQLKSISYGQHSWNGSNITVHTDLKEHSLTCLVEYFMTTRIPRTPVRMLTLEQSGGAK